MNDIEIIERRPERRFGTDIYIIRHDRLRGKSYVLGVLMGETPEANRETWTELQSNTDMIAPTISLDDNVMKALTEHFQKEHPLPVEPGLREVLEDDVDDARKTRDKLLDMLTDAAGRIG